MPFNNLFAYRQTDAGSGIFFSTVQSLKNDKDSLGILWVQPDTIVADRKQPFTGLALSRHVNPWRFLTVELDGIADQVLKELPQLYPIRHHGGEGVVGDDRPAFLDRNPQIAQHLFQNAVAAHLFRHFVLHSDT